MKEFMLLISMNKKMLHKIMTYFIAAVWLINGFFCKVLNLVPRHQLIVSRILGDEYAGFLTKCIGISEMLMTIWILSSIKSRFCATIQILIIGTMNIIEFFIVPDLLLFGKINSIVALMFIIIIYFNEFMVSEESAQNA